MKYTNIKEEELKNKVAQDYFWIYDCTKIIGNVDFCVCMHQNQKELFEQESLLWAEAKTGSPDIYKSIVQLILTVGRARTFDKYLPPPMLGAIDGEKIAFIPYSEIHDVFYQNDFNWNVTPSDHETKEFQLIYEKVKNSIDQKTLLFNYEKDDKELQKFIKNNFKVGKFGLTKTKIDKNNFMVIYNKWLQEVKPTIAVNWESAKKSGIIDGDFYLADLLSQENETLKEKLFVLLKKDHYELDRKLDESGLFSHSETAFKDKQKAHTQFWNKYERPPKQEYWDYIVERRDLLVPQDVRERKGSFFTPQQWVELSQKYIAEVLGENWQDEYYVWDCAAGTGNLLTGLSNKYNIWASTLDAADVEVMHDRIEAMNEKSPNRDGANLLHDHVFKFDFLNDDFTKLPQPLQDIINDKKKCQKLLIYINPPYAEAATADRKGNKEGVSTSKAREKYASLIGNAINELFAQFFAIIYDKIPHSTLAQFSTLKIVQAPNFSKFRHFFKAEFQRGFIVPSYTFDNVKGKFPIGFMIWDLNKKTDITEIKCDVYNDSGNFIGEKTFASTNRKFINDWYKNFYDPTGNEIGVLNTRGNDFQNQNYIHISTKNNFNHTSLITENNLIYCCIYVSVRHCIEATWINDRDQFSYPNEGLETDIEFQNDCLAFSLFHSQNKISSTEGINHWIPFTEKEVNSREKFESNFMTDFISGKIKGKQNTELFDGKSKIPKTPLKFSHEAQEVFNSGKLLWQYYHKQPYCNANASLYDIRAHFQGRSETGKMNNKSNDATYMILISDLRDKLKRLGKKIEPKVYEYEFLKS